MKGNNSPIFSSRNEHGHSVDFVTKDLAQYNMYGRQPSARTSMVFDRKQWGVKIVTTLKGLICDTNWISAEPYDVNAQEFNQQSSQVLSIVKDVSWFIIFHQDP